MMPNPSIERTRTGMALQALISFWALRALPARTAHGRVRHHVEGDASVRDPREYDLPVKMLHGT